MPNDTPTLLANASAADLEAAAANVELSLFPRSGVVLSIADLRLLAELARAVVALEERPTLVHYEDGDWDEDHHHPGYWRTRIRGTMGYSRHSTLCAALAATRHTQGEG